MSSVKLELEANAAGRRVPLEVNGSEQTPFQGVGVHRPQGRKHAPSIRSNADYPANGDKRVDSLEEALRRCGLRDGSVISSHHHLRNGDRVALAALETLPATAARSALESLGPYVLERRW